MMLTEGVGVVAPKPVTITFQGAELQQLLLEATKRAEYRQYRRKSDTWSQGLKGSVVVQGLGAISRDVRPIFAGLLGEYACSLFINRRLGEGTTTVDLESRKYGDYGIDIVAYARTLQVKTRQSDRHGNLVRMVDKTGRRIPRRADAYVFCRWSGFLTVNIVGWQWAQFIYEKPTEPAIVGKHRNVRLDDCELLPMSRLIDDLVCMEAQSGNSIK